MEPQNMPCRRVGRWRPRHWRRLPPPMVMNSLACTLVSGIGNALTRKTSSRTAMPAQRIFAMSEQAVVGLEPGTDDVMGDRERMGRRQAIGVLTQHDGGNFVAREPTGVHHLGPVELELHRRRL